MKRLPPSFTSLYRLFLRASSASVLHQNAARKQLRKLFRPPFGVAAQAIRGLQSNQLSHSERMRYEHFLATFQQCMDGTLSFLLNCAQYRGVPHRLVYNISRLRNAHAVWIHGRYYTNSKNPWNPKMVVGENSKARATHRPREIDRMERNRAHERCWDGLEEVVRMAEGKHKLSLGRLYLKPWTLERR